MKKQILYTLLPLFVAACGSAPTKKEAKVNLAKPSRSFYVEGLSGRSLEQDFSREPCVTGPGLQKKDWKTLVRAANGCLKMGNWKGVDEVAQHLSRLDLESPWGAYYLGLVAEHKGDLPRAVWMVDLALKKSDGSVGLFRYQKGRLLWSLKEYSEGFAEVKAAVKEDPGLLEGHLFLADVYARDLQSDMAKRHYREALELSPANARAKRGLASFEENADKPVTSEVKKK